MPGTRLRGAFADVDLMGDVLGLSVSHGQEQEPSGVYYHRGQSQFTDSYIDAAKLTLFPKSNTDQYSFNFATAYGPDRPAYLTDHVYSVEGQHKFNDFLTLNGEEAMIAAMILRWHPCNGRKGLLSPVLISGILIKIIPLFQPCLPIKERPGRCGQPTGILRIFTESTFIEAYQEHLYSNPDDPSAFNYDANGHVRANITKDLWSDTDFNFVDTPGELSPTSSVGLNERLSRSFGIWNSLKGLFSGVQVIKTAILRVRMFPTLTAKMWLPVSSCL